MAKNYVKGIFLTDSKKKKNSQETFVLESNISPWDYIWRNCIWFFTYLSWQDFKLSHFFSHKPCKDKDITTYLGLKASRPLKKNKKTWFTDASGDKVLN